MSLYARQLRQIQQEADDTLKKLGDGAFGRNSSDESAMERVMYRKGLLRALEILRASAHSDETEDL